MKSNGSDPYSLTRAADFLILHLIKSRGGAVIRHEWKVYIQQNCFFLTRADKRRRPHPLAKGYGRLVSFQGILLSSFLSWIHDG